ncbi:unnamed protein product [Oikopleura dioica]|uniref:Uncharacterized protein n=1 Tax=Oikopleura dioica TaxID=34765 RepID=E4YRY5_OIKDI|nr:unnamed protein product [Oikopleura dioica]
MQTAVLKTALARPQFRGAKKRDQKKIFKSSLQSSLQSTTVMSYLDSPPASPLNESTEAPSATLEESLTCRVIQKRAKLSRKRSLEISDSPPPSPTRCNTPPVSEPRPPVIVSAKRRRVEEPKVVEKSREVENFEKCISVGHWSAVFARFGPQLATNTKLLEDIDLNIYDKSGHTALLAACALGDARLAITLVKLGARIDLTSMSGWSVWHYAVRKPLVMIAMLDYVYPKMS